MTAGSSRPLRIGIGAPYDLARAGGVNTHIRSQARALRRLGHDVRIFGTSSAPSAADEIILGRALPLLVGGTETGVGFDPRAWHRAIRLCRMQRFDVVHLHEPLMPLANWAMLRHAAAPIVGTFHAYRERGHRWYPKLHPLLAPLIRRLAVRVAVSDAARRTVSRHFPGDYDVVPNGIDLDAFRTTRPRPAAMSPDRFHVVYVGRLEPRKGVGHLISAMAAVQRSAPACALTLVGDGPDRERLCALARTTGAVVTFVGRVDDASLPAYLQAADVVCSPAIGGESFGIVLLEAMASGKPFVATRIPGYTELAGAADCGVLVPPDDPEALTAAISSFALDPDRCRRLGTRGPRFARAYDWSTIAARLDAIYQRLVPAAPIAAVSAG